MKNIENTLLSLLSDGDIHSGEKIAGALGVSRTAVWKHLQKLSALGLSVESVKGKGYRLQGGIELLSLDAIHRSLNPLLDKALVSIDIRSQVDSTNKVALSHAAQSVNEGSSARGYVCLAESQQQGRGRRGREWVSPFGHNVYLSLVWDFDGGAAQLEGLSLAVGVVVADVLSAMGLDQVSLKWPNDILLHRRKLGGILLEMVGDPAGQCQVVIGLGVNVVMPSDVEIDQPWEAIRDHLPAFSRNDLVANLLSGLVLMLTQFHQKGFGAYREAWEQYDAYRNAQVLISSDRQSLQGIARGVYDNGALRLEVDGCDQAVYGGEISLRLADAS